MVRWLIVVFLALVLINGLTPWLRRLGLGRLPGDFDLRAACRPLAGKHLGSGVHRQWHRHGGLCLPDLVAATVLGLVQRGVGVVHPVAQGVVPLFGR